MINEGLQSFILKRQGSAEDIGANITLRDRNEMNSITAGFEWDIEGDGFMGGWTVDGYYQYGENERRAYQIGLRVDRIFAAVDAVVNPATGQIVCRTTLFSCPVVSRSCACLKMFCERSSTCWTFFPSFAVMNAIGA